VIFVDTDSGPHPLLPNCFGADSHVGKFCFDQGKFTVQLPYAKHDGSRIELVSHYWGLIAVIIAVFLVSRPFIRRIVNPTRLGQKSTPADKQTTTKVTLWMTLFLTVFAIWINTALTETQGFWIVLRFCLSFIVIPLILLLEALAMSVLELEDKELPEQIEKIGSIEQARIILQAYLIDSGAYLRAREWFLAGLIILLTMVVEFKKYDIPLLGSYEGGLARVVFTGVFATIAVIWTAQAPGKEIGKNRPIKFLCLWIGPQQVHKIVVQLSRLARWSCIDKPSQVTAHYLDGLLRMTDEPPLAPGGSRFFTELIKRYGYGDLAIEEVYTIDEFGGAELEQKETVYLGVDKELSYTRRFACDEPFVRLPEVTFKEAIIVSTLSASLDQDMKNWERGLGVEKVWDRHVRTKVEWLNDDRKTAIISVSLPLNRLQKDQAFVLTIKTKANTEPGAFKGPSNLGEDYWTRNLVKPCYQAQTLIKLKSPKFSAVFDRVAFTAFQEENSTLIVHEPETRRFKELQLLQDRKNKAIGITTTDGVPIEGKSLFVKVSYGLPGVKYKTTWEMTLEPPIRSVDSIGFAAHD
jgi:hypothetical protein